MDKLLPVIISCSFLLRRPAALPKWRPVCRQTGKRRQEADAAISEAHAKEGRRVRDYREERRFLEVWRIAICAGFLYVLRLQGCASNVSRKPKIQFELV